MNLTVICILIKETEFGKTVGSFCAMSDVLIFAMPISIISSNFSSTIANIYSNLEHTKYEIKLSL